MIDYSLMHYLLIFGTILFLIVMPVGLLWWMRREMRHAVPSKPVPPPVEDGLHD